MVGGPGDPTLLRVKPDWRSFRDQEELLRLRGIAVEWLVTAYNRFGCPDDGLSRTLSFLDRAACGGITPWENGQRGAVTLPHI